MNQHPMLRLPGPGTETSTRAPEPWMAALLLAALLAASLPPRPARGAGGELDLSVVDQETGEPVPCRIHLRAAQGRARRLAGAPFWHDHSTLPGRVTLKLPVGTYEFEIERGPEYAVASGYFTINPHAADSKEVPLKRFVHMADEGWYAGDLFVRRPVRDMELLMKAEDLHVVPLVTWWNGNEDDSVKIPSAGPVVQFGGDRCCHLLGGGLTRPGGTYLAFQRTAVPELDLAQPGFPSTAALIAKLRSQPGVWIDAAVPYAWDLPLLVALGQVDSIEVVHSGLGRLKSVNRETGGKPRDPALFPGPWGNAQWSQQVYFHLLNCGLRIPPSAGSGSGVTPNPPGYNRLYVHVDGGLTCDKWWKSLKAGQVVVTNGPLLRPRVHGQLPGYTFQAEEGVKVDLEVGLTLSTRERISYLEIVKDGRIEHSISFQEYAKEGKLPQVVFDRSGWFLVRAVADTSKTYRFGMTGPYFVSIGGQPRISKASAQFFLDWVFERARQLKLDEPRKQRAVIDDHRKARDFWQDLVDRANAP